MSIPTPPQQAPDEALGDGLPEDDLRGPSKTRRKKNMHALQTLGEKLVAVAEEKLVTLDLPERLVDAIRQARVTRSHEGRRRQMQFIGKLMRDVDPAEIEALLAVDAGHHRAQVRAMQDAERWRDTLLSGQRTLTEFIDLYPAGARAGLPQLLTQARREQQQSRPPRSQRVLYRELYRLIEGARVAAARTGAADSDGAVDLDASGAPDAAAGLDAGAEDDDSDGFDDSWGLDASEAASDTPSATPEVEDTATAPARGRGNKARRKP